MASRLRVSIQLLRATWEKPSKWLYDVKSIIRRSLLVLTSHDSTDLLINLSKKGFLIISTGQIQGIIYRKIVSMTRKWHTPHCSPTHGILR